MNNNIKVIWLFCLASLLIGCGGSSGESNNTSTSSQSATSTASAPSQTSRSPTFSSNTSSHASASNNATDTGTGTGRLITIRWSIPTNREDGTTLSLNEIARYEIYYFRGDTPSDDGTVITVNDAAITRINFSLPGPGTYYFAIASVDTLGAYSDVSDPLSLHIP